MKSELRPHQVTAIDMMRQSFREGHRSPMLQLPTGSGKTKIAAACVESAYSRGGRVMFCVPFITLIDQTVESFFSEGLIELGVQQADHYLTNVNQPIQICSIDTLTARANKAAEKAKSSLFGGGGWEFPEADVVFIDEAHRRSQFITEWINSRPDQKFVGLSATPWSKGLGLIYDDLIRPISMQELIDQGWLSPFKVYAPGHPDLAGVKVQSTGEYATKALSKVMSDERIVADIVDSWLKLGNDEQTIAFCVDRLHARYVQNKFESAGVPTGYVDAYTSLEDRAYLFRQFANGDIRVICNVGVLTTGFDADVRCVILARPVRGAMLHVQMIGRGLRPAEGKETCIILDHADNHRRLGFVTECDMAYMDCSAKGEKQKESGAAEKVPKECSACKGLRDPVKLECPHCGHVPEPESDIVETKGNLEEMTLARVEEQRRKMQEWYSALMTVAVDRGYKPKYPDACFKEKFGMWPPPYIKKKRGAVTDDVQKFLTAKAIRYRKGAAKQGVRA